VSNHGQGPLMTPLATRALYSWSRRAGILRFSASSNRCLAGRKGTSATYWQHAPQPSQLSITGNESMRPSDSGLNGPSRIVAATPPAGERLDGVPCNSTGREPSTHPAAGDSPRFPRAAFVCATASRCRVWTTNGSKGLSPATGDYGPPVLAGREAAALPITSRGLRSMRLGRDAAARAPLQDLDQFYLEAQRRIAGDRSRPRLAVPQLARDLQLDLAPLAD
jgi:hypothetical protein